MLYDLRDESVLNQIIEIVDSTDNQNRIDKHLSDYQIANGNQKKHVEDAIKIRYPESWEFVTPISLSIAKKIIRKLSRCYSQGLKREVVDKKTGVINKPLTELINYVYQDVDENEENFNDTMQAANEFYSNHRYVEIFTYVNDDGKVRFKSLPQHLFTVMPDKNKKKAEVLIFRHEMAEFSNAYKFIDWDLLPEQTREESEITHLFTVWSKEMNFQFVRLKTVTVDSMTDEQAVVFRTIPLVKDGNKDRINPYKILPFAAVKERTEGHYYPYGVEISDMSKEINVMLSDIVTIAAQQGFGQAVIYFDGDKPPAITKSGPTHIINIPNKTGNSKFEFANANPDLAGHLGIALSITRMLLTTNDLTTDKVSGELSATNFASAIDRLIADSETIENIEDQRKKYISAEKNQFKVTIAVLKYLKEVDAWPEEYPAIGASELDSKKYHIKLAFNTIKPLVTEKDKADTIVFLEEKGLILPHEKHSRFNDDMDEKDAIKREEAIQAAKKKKQDEFISSEAGKVKFGRSNQEDQSFGNPQEKQTEDRRGLANFRGQKENRERDNRADQRENPVRNRGQAKR